MLGGHSSSGKRRVSSKRAEMKKKEYHTLPEYSNLESLIIQSSKALIKKTYPSLKATTKIHSPHIYWGMTLCEIAYKNRDEIKEAWKKTNDIWEDKESPVSDKLEKSINVLAEHSGNIAKKEIKDYVNKTISEEFSEAAIEILDENKILDKISDATGLENQKERFKLLLQDIIEKETNKGLEQIEGDLIG